MFKKVKEIVSHPYAAPLTETLKGIGGFARHPVRRFTERIREGFDDDFYKYEKDEVKNQPRLLRMYKRLCHTDDSAGVTSFFGFILGGIGGGIAGGVMAAGGGAGWLGITLGATAMVGVGVAAGPFLLAGVIAAGAACAGSIIGGLPGFVKGCQIAIDHRKLLKAGAQVTAASPAAAQDENLAQALAKALAPFNDLTPEQQAAYVKMMNEQHQEAVRGQSEKLLQALASLPDGERDKLLRGLKPQLKDEFEKLAQRDANNSTVLQNEITTGGPIRLKAKNQRP